MFCKMADEYALPATRGPTWTRAKAAQLKAMSEAEFDRVVRETPLVDHRLKLQSLKGEGFTKKEFDEAYGRMDYVFERCETALAGGPYLAGQDYMLADIAILPYVFAFNLVRPELMAGHPLTKDWYERIMARPAVKSTYQPSHEAPAQ